MRPLASALLLLGLGACQGTVSSQTADLPDITRVSVDMSEIGKIDTGLTHIYFSDWAGPRLPVWVYVPETVDPKTAPIMVMMHGAKRGAARYLSEWDQIADEEGFIIVAPEFTREDFPGSAGYNLGNRTPRKSTELNDEAIWSFSAIELVFDHVVAELESTQTEYTLYGHSAGSQFIHRFMYFKPDARVKRYLPANAGWYSFPDLELDYPMGLGGLGLTDDDLKAILEQDVVLLLGDQDNDPNHSSLKRGDGAAQQGPHRFARGQNFYAKGKAEAERLGVDFGWRVRIIEGVAHSNGGIGAASGDLIE